MLRNGTYAAWYRTPLGAGTGIVRLADGKISGGDLFITYGGSYEVDGDLFTATLTTKRHAPGEPTVFGVDEVDVQLAGRCSGTVASCAGAARQAPDLHFEVTLIFDQEQVEPEPKHEVVDFCADRRPRGQDGKCDGRSRVQSLQARIVNELS